MRWKVLVGLGLAGFVLGVLAHEEHTAGISVSIAGAAFFMAGVQVYLAERR